jgi:hypothetical protein
MRYFINHEGLQKGPWTIEEIKQKISSNEINPMDYVFDEDRSDWVVMMAYAPFTSFLKPGGPVEAKAPAQAPAGPESAESKDDWFVLRGDSKYGPFKYLDLVKMLQAKQLFEFDFVWNKSMSSWIRISESENFQPEKIKQLKSAAGPEAKDVFYRRKHARVQIGASILLHNNKEVWKGRSVELSSGGAGLVIPSHEIQIGQDLFLHFKAGDGVPPFNAVCKIVSKANLKNKEFRYGVKFTSISQSVQVAIKKYTDKAA